MSNAALLDCGAYAGEISPGDAWSVLANDRRSALVDVRTHAEWVFTGSPDLSALGKTPIQLSWKLYPSMSLNPGFISSLTTAVMEKDTPLLFLCRSGGRSFDAAIAMTACGYTHCYNIGEGFEGRMDNYSHRGAVSGWKAGNLPWIQS